MFPGTWSIGTHAPDSCFHPWAGGSAGGVRTGGWRSDHQIQAPGSPAAGGESGEKARSFPFREMMQALHAPRTAYASLEKTWDRATHGCKGDWEILKHFPGNVMIQSTSKRRVDVQEATPSFLPESLTRRLVSLTALQGGRDNGFSIIDSESLRELHEQENRSMAVRKIPAVIYWVNERPSGHRVMVRRWATLTRHYIDTVQANRRTQRGGRPVMKLVAGKLLTKSGCCQEMGHPGTGLLSPCVQPACKDGRCPWCPHAALQLRIRTHLHVPPSPLKTTRMEDAQAAGSGTSEADPRSGRGDC